MRKFFKSSESQKIQRLKNNSKRKHQRHNARMRVLRSLQPLIEETAASDSLTFRLAAEASASTKDGSN